MKGIDISNNQGCIDFSKVKSDDVDLVYIKATQGTTFTDGYLIDNYNKAKDAGFKIGFYHFLGHSDPIDEAKHFLQAIEGLESDCLFIIDIEGDNWNINDASNAVREFADYLISKGKQPGVYTGDYFYRDNLNNSVKDLPVWVAKYGANQPMVSSYAGWQYSETGSISGINGNVDLDLFTDSILIKKEVENKVNNIVVFGNEVDKRAAEYLADYLNCPTISNGTPFDYSQVKNIYAVGGGEFTGYVKQIIKGADRFETVKEVLHFCGKLW
jgi:lysozyme